LLPFKLTNLKFQIHTNEIFFINPLVFTASNIVIDVVLELQSLFYLTIIRCHSAGHTLSRGRVLVKSDKLQL